MNLLIRVTVLLIACELVCLLLGRFAPRLRPAVRLAVLAATCVLPVLMLLLPDVAPVRVPGDSVVRAWTTTSDAVAGWGWVVAVWMLGAGVRAVISIVGQWRITRMLSDTSPMRSSVPRRILRRALARSGVGRRVALRWRPGPGGSACVAGFVRPAILLPWEARHWSADRLEAVLLHELEHVRRGDIRGWLLAEIACCLYWFHPLAWYCAARYRVESDIACDDAVVIAGVRPSRYAADLLALATSPGALFEPVAFARRRWLSERVTAVLHPGRVRGRVPGRTSLAVGLAALVAAIGIATLNPARVVAVAHPAAGVPRTIVVHPGDGAGSRTVEVTTSSR